MVRDGVADLLDAGEVQTDVGEAHRVRKVRVLSSPTRSVRSLSYGVLKRQTLLKQADAYRALSSSVAHDS
jgi:hypothetical protein